MIARMRPAASHLGLSRRFWRLVQETADTAPRAVADAPLVPRPRPTGVLIANPRATATPEHVRKLVVAALRGSLDLVVASTERKAHAAELARRAAEDGVELVIAFGGDGTVNEIVN